MNYIGVCNQALNQNKNRFPFKQILGAARDAKQGKKVEVRIAGNTAKDSYVISIEEGRITATPHGQCKNCQCNRVWNVDKNYIQDVTKKPAQYISNPAKINWEWMVDGEINSS